jgi:hypothetical protein
MGPAGHLFPQRPALASETPDRGRIAAQVAGERLGSPALVEVIGRNPRHVLTDCLEARRRPSWRDSRSTRFEDQFGGLPVGSKSDTATANFFSCDQARGSAFL